MRFQSYNNIKQVLSNMQNLQSEKIYKSKGRQRGQVYKYMIYYSFGYKEKREKLTRKKTAP